MFISTTQLINSYNNFSIKSNAHVWSKLYNVTTQSFIENLGGDSFSTEENYYYDEKEYYKNYDFDEDEHNDEEDDAFYDEQLKLIEKIEECDKESFIYSIEKEENDDLFNMLYTILDYHEFSLYDELDYLFYGYENMNEVLKSDSGKRVYKSLHPSLNSELKNLSTYLKKKKIIDSLDKLKITSLFKYIYSLLITNAPFSKGTTKQLFANSLKLSCLMLFLFIAFIGEST